jgi:hypothetical protein
MPLPIQAASAALWADDAHVAANRAHYARLVAAADRIFSGYSDTCGRRADSSSGSTFGDGEAAAKRFWREGGIRVVPGAT